MSDTEAWLDEFDKWYNDHRELTGSLTRTYIACKAAWRAASEITPMSDTETLRDKKFAEFRLSCGAKPDDPMTDFVQNIFNAGYRAASEITQGPAITDRPQGGDFEALAVLKTNFYDCAGIFVRRKQSHQPTSEEWKAINYLCDEWDYGYEGGWAAAYSPREQAPTPTEFPYGGFEKAVLDCNLAGPEAFATDENGRYRYDQMRSLAQFWRAASEITQARATIGNEREACALIAEHITNSVEVNPVSGSREGGRARQFKIGTKIAGAIRARGKE